MSNTHDIPYQLLFQHAQSEPRAILWLADESFPSQGNQVLDIKQDRLITNRYDVFASLKGHAKHAPCEFCDFNDASFESFTGNLIFYRVSKEKAVTHYLINQAYRQLPIGGELHLAGFKGDGIKTYLDKAKQLFGEMITLENGPNTAKYGVLKKTEDNNDLLDDKDYTQIREIAPINDIPVVSKPGVFGWKKSDPGSEFLIHHLDDFLADYKRPIQRVLDLGCGYGFIALHAQQHERFSNATFVLTDNNAAAIDCATLNIEKHQLNGSVVADDCGKSITERFDVILCNPPFHKGFDVSNDITNQFLSHVSRMLSGKGRALLVVNQFVGIEKRAEPYFQKVTELARNKSFKLIVLSQPKG